MVHSRLATRETGVYDRPKKKKRLLLYVIRRPQKHRSTGLQPSPRTSLTPHASAQNQHKRRSDKNKEARNLPPTPNAQPNDDTRLPLCFPPCLVLYTMIQQPFPFPCLAGGLNVLLASHEDQDVARGVGQVDLQRLLHRRFDVVLLRRLGEVPGTGLVVSWNTVGSR